MSGQSAVVVFGASRGIGRAVVEVLAESGTAVVAVARSEYALSSAAAAWAAQRYVKPVRTLACDVLTELGRSALMRELAQVEVQGVVAVAGSGRPSGVAGSAAMRAAMAANVDPIAELVEMVRATVSGQRGKTVLVVSSIAAREWIRCPAEYAASKAALEVLVGHWAREFAPARVVGIAPGNVETIDSVWARRRAEAPDDLAQFLKQEVPLNRLGRPQEIAEICSFLLSDRASFITGTTIVADGGQTRAW